MSRSEVVEEVTVKIRRTTTETVEASLTHTESVSALLIDAYTSIYDPITRATFTKVWTFGPADVAEGDIFITEGGARLTSEGGAFFIRESAPGYTAAYTELY